MPLNSKDAGRGKAPGAWFRGKALTMGVSGELGGSVPSGVGSAIMVLHGPVQVEREGSGTCSWVPRGGETPFGRWVLGEPKSPARGSGARPLTMGG